MTSARLWELNLVITFSDVKGLALVKRNARICRLVRKYGALWALEITFCLTQRNLKI